MSVVHRVLGVLYTLGLIGFSFVAAIIGVYAFSPTMCPSSTQQLLCDNPEWQSRGLGLFALGLAVAVVVALVACCVRTTKVGLLLQAGSVAVVVLDFALLSTVAG